MLTNKVTLPTEVTPFHGNDVVFTISYTYKMNSKGPTMDP